MRKDGHAATQTGLLVSSTADGIESGTVGVGETLLVDHAEALHVRPGKVHGHLLQLVFQLVLPLDQPLALFLCLCLSKSQHKNNHDSRSTLNGVCPHVQTTGLSMFVALLFVTQSLEHGTHSVSRLFLPRKKQREK